MTGQITTRVTSDYEFVQAYLELLNGVLKLTPTELRVLVEFVYGHYQMLSEDATEEEIGDVLFSMEFRELVRSTLSKERPMSKNSLTGFLKGLLDKGLIVNTVYGFGLDARLIPVTTLTFQIIKDYE